MATGFRDFSRDVGGRRGTATLGGLSTFTAETDSLDVQIDAGSIFDFFEQRDQDKSDRAFLKKNAEDFGFTPDEIDDFSRSDLRKLKSQLLKESAAAGVEGKATQNFLDVISQQGAPLQDQGDPLQALFQEAPLTPPIQGQVPAEGIREMDVLGLGGEQTDPRFPVQPGLSEEEFNIEAIAPSPIVESGLRPSVPIGSVQPQNFGSFVDEASDPTLRPMQQIQEALLQLNPRDAARIQNDPIFGGILAMAKRTPQSGQLVQDAKGDLWNVTFNIDGSVKDQRKLGITKKVPGEKNTIKVLQVQREDGSLGMDAVSINNDGKIINQTPVPGAVPKTLKIDLGTTKPTKTKIEQELISISTDLNELGRLRDSLLTTKGRPKELLTPIGRMKSAFFELADRAGALDPDLPLGAVVKNLEEITGSKIAPEMAARIKEFRRVENQVGRIFTKFRKEITGVAGPPEEFERLEAISLSIRKLGPIGLDAAIQVLEDSKRDQQELLKNVFLANNKEEFLRALGGRMDSRIEGLRIKFQNNPTVLSAINKADSEKIQEQELRRDIVGEERRFNKTDVPQALIDTLNSLN